ncbi:MAG: hypothetical protein ACI87E_001975, partial [Mariniblastus sp.]
VARQHTDVRNGQLMKVGRRVFLAGMVVTATGCQNMIRRGQSPDTDSMAQLFEEKEEVSRYIGDVCGIYGLNFAKVDGIGLVVGLDGTGSAAKPNKQREHVLRAISSNPSYGDSNKMVASLDTEIVAITGLLPPGIRKGETYDLKIRAIANSEAESLENGMTLQARMQPMARLGGGIKQGKTTGIGRGRVLVDALFESRQDKPDFLKGVVLGGGKALEDRPLGLKVGGEKVSDRTTTMMARAINERFTTVDVAGRKGVAEAKNNRQIDLVVPESYRQNIGRYFGVIKSITYDEPVAERVNRMEELDREIGQPSKSMMAAIRLEALGKAGIPALTRALRHHDLEVQFHAAQALAYSGQADGVDVLVRAAKEEPAFRWDALTALSSLNDIAASSALESLMHMQSAETRYGAFRAMMAQSPGDPVVTGEWLAGDFFLHEVASESEPLLHFSRVKRPEIVVFGDHQTVTDDFLHVESGLTVRANGNGTVSIINYSTEFGKEQETCSSQIGDVIRNLAKMGYGYGPMLKMLRSAKQAGTLNTRLVVNAVPKLGRTYSPDGGEIPPETSDKYVAGKLPELFRTGEERVSTRRRVDESLVGDINAEIEKENETRWDKVKGWFAGSED